LQASKILKKRWPHVNIVLISSSQNADVFLRENSGDYDSFEPKTNELSGMLRQIRYYQKKKQQKYILISVIVALSVALIIILLLNKFL